MERTKKAMTKYRFEWTEKGEPQAVIYEATGNATEQDIIKKFRADFGRDVKPIKIKT